MIRDLGRLTSPDIAALEKKRTVIVLPLGAMEQHGPHLAIDTDLLFTEELLNRALAALAPETSIYRLPALPITKSNEHVGFPGSLWISGATLTAYIMDVAQSLKASGFTRLVLWNCHGGNRSLLEVIARDVRIATGLLVFAFFPPALVQDPVPVPEKESRLGIHAGDFETSLMLALSPDRVRRDKLEAFYPALPDLPVDLEFSGATFAWTSRDLSPSGTFGDATLASVERGEQRLAALIPALAAALEAATRFDFPAR
jgi:creatinine amidohydrolase